MAARAVGEPNDLSSEPFCYLTTTGRLTGRPHTIEIWFALHASTLYLLSGRGRRADWVRNVVRNPRVSVRIHGREFEGAGRVVSDPDEDRLARNLLRDKYPGDLGDWLRSALPVAIELGGGQR